MARLEERGIEFESAAATLGQPVADPLDLLCHLAYGAPVLTRRERAAFFAQFQPEAREILNEVLDKYQEAGVRQLAMPDVLMVQPIARHGNVMEIASRFGGAARMWEAVTRMQALLYAG